LLTRNGVRAGILGVAAAGYLACAMPSAAGAQVALVNTTTDDAPDGACDAAPGDCTLREAITDSTAPEVQVPMGTYVLTGGELPVTRDVTIRGTGAGLPTIRPHVEFPSRVMRIFSDSEVVMSRVRIASGFAPSDSGGGILVDSFGELELSDSEIADNRATEGAGIWADGALLVRNSLIVGNAVVGAGQGRGGGIGLGAGDAAATIVNTTVTDNESDGWGGGLFARRSMMLQNVSIVENTAPPRGANEQTGRGGGLSQEFANAPNAVTTARNVLVARNVNGGCGGTVFDPIDSVQGLVDEPLPTTTCNVINQDPAVNFIVADAGVGALADNGGPTRTHALLTGSPALDRGQACPPDDQRGVLRPQGAACDIGAYEFVPPAPPQQGGGGGGTTQPPPPPEDELPPPEAGETVNALPARGTVKVRLPGTNRFVELEEGQQLPVGTVVDTLNGRVTLVAAGGQTATFYDGIFKIGQGKGAKPLTTLTLVEKLSCPKAGKAVAAAKKKKRRLWGDGSGRFRTKGKHSAATVVGTKWLVEDRCSSTLTRVTQGRVSVRDFVKKKTVTVRAGKKYVARAKKK
jgi:CSLREA domain-containing protein